MVGGGKLGWPVGRGAEMRAGVGRRGDLQLRPLADASWMGQVGCQPKSTQKATSGRRGNIGDTRAPGSELRLGME